MLLATCLLPLICSCNQTASRLVINRVDVPASINLTSPAFKNGAALPAKYTTSQDISPPLAWSNVPPATRSLVILMEDADVPPPNPYLHWVIYNIPPTVTSLPEGLPREKKPKAIPGSVQGKNSRKRLGYAHPAPIDRKPHRYHIEIFALDDVIDPESGKTKAQVVTEMNGHVLTKGELICSHRAK
jgi:hypothetical protein